MIVDPKHIRAELQQLNPERVDLPSMILDAVAVLISQFRQLTTQVFDDKSTSKIVALTRALVAYQTDYSLKFPTTVGDITEKED